MSSSTWSGADPDRSPRLHLGQPDAGGPVGEKPRSIDRPSLAGVAPNNRSTVPTPPAIEASSHRRRYPIHRSLDPALRLPPIPASFGKPVPIVSNLRLRG